MSQPARFHVVVRFGDRVVADVCVDDALTLGEGGDVVVPGVGDVAQVLQHGALRSVAGLDGEVVRGELRAALVGEGVVLQEGERCELRSVAHPSIAIVIERIASERVAMRSRIAFAPARETIFAGALACCMATMLGGKVVIGSLTEAEIEREQTALEIAMFETTPVIPAVMFTPPIVYAAPDLEPIADAPALADASALAEAALHDEIGEQIAPEALPVEKPAPKKRRARPRRRVQDTTAMVAILSSSTDYAIIGALSDSTVVDNVLTSVEGVEGGVVGGVGAIAEPGGGGGTGEAIGIGTVGAEVATKSEVVPEALPTDVAPVQAEAKAEPVPEDPRHGNFTLADALAGTDLVHGKGKLVAQMHVSGRLLRCELFEDRAPIAVANFVGLIRGTRETLDPATNRWTKKRFYEGLTFHRVVDGFVIQGGDPKGDGTGGPGYRIPDEIDPGFHFDRAGILAMANSGPDTGGSQFYITLGPAPHLDGKQTAFGQCDPEAPQALGKTPTVERERPTKPPKIGKAWVIRVDDTPAEDVVSPQIIIGAETPEPTPEPPADPAALDAADGR